MNQGVVWNCLLFYFYFQTLAFKTPFMVSNIFNLIDLQVDVFMLKAQHDLPEPTLNKKKETLSLQNVYKNLCMVKCQYSFFKYISIKKCILISEYFCRIKSVVYSNKLPSC